MMQQRSANVKFIKFRNNKDTLVIKIIAPYEGFDRKVKQMNSEEMKEKPHYRMYKIGDFNFETKKPLSDPPLELTANEIRELKPEDASIWTTPFHAANRIAEEIDKQHTFLMIRRHGKQGSTATTYDVLNAQQIDDNEWGSLLPNVSKSELKKLQTEESWEDISDEELHKLETLGVKENEQ